MLDISQIPLNQPLRVIIGAGTQTYPGWIPTQREQLDLLIHSDWVNSFKDRAVDALLCEHVWEHLTLDQAATAAANCYEFLRPGGYLRCAVPDGNYPDEEYQRFARGEVPKDHPASDHKVVYDYHLFTRIFETAGFEVDLLEYCDEDGRFHYNQWNVADGTIYRSLMIDHRNKAGEIGYVSLIVDARKPTSPSG